LFKEEWINDLKVGNYRENSPWIESSFYKGDPEIVIESDSLKRGYPPHISKWGINCQVCKINEINIQGITAGGKPVSYRKTIKVK
jgi:hypothetical protein